MLLKDKRLKHRIEDLHWMILKNHGIMVFQELTHYFKKIDLH